MDPGEDLRNVKKNGLEQKENKSKGMTAMRGDTTGGSGERNDLRVRRRNNEMMAKGGKKKQR